YSSNSHTGEFLTNEISDIVKKLSSDKFAAVVTNTASNYNSTCQKIQKMYSQIWNIRCAVHAINFIVSNLVKLDNLKKLIVNCGKINNFFNSSHLSHSLLVKGFIDMKIKGGGLKVWLFSKHKESIFNQEIANLIANEDFFTMCRLVQKDLNDNGFHKAALTTIEIWQSLGHTRSESNELGSFRKQHHLPELTLRIFSINPMQANCNHQTSLNINKLKGISKIKFYYMANIQHELNFFGKELTETDLQDVCNISLVSKIMDYNEEQTDANNEPLLEDMFNDSTTLLIGEILT
ncbi:7376_t:CDS:2, partial [Gigaspora margarita]